MVKPGTISKGKAIERVSAQINGPVSLNEFTDRVLAIWPSQAKDPKGNIRQAIKDNHLGKDLLFLDKTTLIPIHLAMRGVRFRVPLSRQEVERGWLFVFPSFQFMFKWDLQPGDLELEDMNGHNIPVNPVKVKLKEKTIFGVHEFEKTAFDLGWWYKKHNIRRKDSLLVTILDWETGRFQLQPEPAREYKKHRAEIQAQNQALADQLFEALESARYESVWGQVAIPTAYLLLKDRNAYPSDHWLEVIEKDPRMSWTGNKIRYADWRSPLEEIVREHENQTSVPTKTLSKQQAGQVYRFKAYLRYRKGLWRRIEIQGGQTLADFDSILRDAFDHDSSDHLSGFWKLIRRGTSRRFRKVDIGNINPFHEGEAARVRVADLEMIPGETLKYVYDFGDWIEHRIELEAIVKPEPGAGYPRITGQNKPRYRYCEVCKKEGRKTVAKWICITCSNQEQREVLFCEDCLNSHDEDHYEEEMIY